MDEKRRRWGGRGGCGCVSGCGSFIFVFLLGGALSLFNSVFGIGLSVGIPFTQSNVTVDNAPATVASATSPDDWQYVDGPEQDNNWSLQIIAPCDLNGASTANETTDDAGNHVYRFDGDAITTPVLDGKCAGKTGIVTVTTEHQFLVLCRYVESNAANGGLVPRAEDWPYCSLVRTKSRSGRELLSPWPVPRPPGWAEYLNDNRS